MIHLHMPQIQMSKNNGCYYIPTFNTILGPNFTIYSSRPTDNSVHSRRPTDFSGTINVRTAGLESYLSVGKDFPFYLYCPSSSMGLYTETISKKIKAIRAEFSTSPIKFSIRIEIISFIEYFPTHLTLFKRFIYIYIPLPI